MESTAMSSEFETNEIDIEQQFVRTDGRPRGEHLFYDREDELMHCQVCGGAEADLPTNCPGERISAERCFAIADGRLDFRGRQWWVPLTGNGMPMKGAKISLMWISAGQTTGAINECYEQEGMLAVPGEDGVTYVRRQDAMGFFGLVNQAPFNEDHERPAFEDACYAHYLKRREERAASGQGIAMDAPDRVRPRDEMFARTEGGDYVAMVYQAAWGGWKMARGG
jgi:hypothetical protein